LSLGRAAGKSPTGELDRGEGVKKDLAEAVKYYKLAARPAP